MVNFRCITQIPEATSKKKVTTSNLPFVEVMTIDKKMSKEEAGMEVSTFNQSTIVENEKLELKKEFSNAEVKMEESSFAATLECVDDNGENEVNMDLKVKYEFMIFDFAIYNPVSLFFIDISL